MNRKRKIFVGLALLLSSSLAFTAGANWPQIPATPGQYGSGQAGSQFQQGYGSTGMGSLITTRCRFADGSVFDFAGLPHVPFTVGQVCTLISGYYVNQGIGVP